jgi:predicted transposase YdaD
MTIHTYILILLIILLPKITIQFTQVVSSLNKHKQHKQQGLARTQGRRMKGQLDPQLDTQLDTQSQLEEESGLDREKEETTTTKPTSDAKKTKHYHCYCLRSTNPSNPESTYVGFTTNPTLR